MTASRDEDAFVREWHLCSIVTIASNANGRSSKSDAWWTFITALLHSKDDGSLPALASTIDTNQGDGVPLINESRTRTSSASRFYNLTMPLLFSLRPKAVSSPQGQ